MIVRIVKMKFQNDKINDFKQFSDKIKPAIRSQKGCISLEILQDSKVENIFFTVSEWKTEQDLNNYRNSDFFKEVWPKAKEWFIDKPEAWSLVNTDKDS